MKITRLALAAIMVVALTPSASAMCATKIDCVAQPINSTFRTHCNFTSPGDNPDSLSARKNGKTLRQCEPVWNRMGVEDPNGTQVRTTGCGVSREWVVTDWSKAVDIQPQDVDGEVSITYGGVSVKVTVKAKQYCAVYFPIIDPDSGKITGDCGGGNGVEDFRNCNL